jgi:hypothetical protein
LTFWGREEKKNFFSRIRWLLCFFFSVFKSSQKKNDCQLKGLKKKLSVFETVFFFFFFPSIVPRNTEEEETINATEPKNAAHNATHENWCANL